MTAVFDPKPALAAPPHAPEIDARISLDDNEFDALVDMIENPRAPSPAAVARVQKALRAKGQV